jgi:hypothetical protein
MNAWRRHLLLATAMSVAFLASGVPAHATGASAPPPDQEVQSWALTPANIDPNKGGNRSELTYVSDRGTVIEDAVTLYNLGTDTMNFRVFATDAFNTEEGQFDVLPSDQPPTDVGSWVTFPQEMITVPPGQQVTMPISITIPADATAGDHVGAVLAASPSVGVGGNGEVITLDRRTGTRIYLRVNGPLFPELAVADVETTYEQSVNPLGGTAHVTYRIQNRGNVRLAGTASLTVGGPFGIGEQTISLPDVPELLPGEDIVVTTDVADVPAAFLDVTTVRVLPTGATDVGAVQESTGKDLTVAPPIAVLGLLLALLFGLLAFRAYRRHRTLDGAARVAPAPRELEREHQPT